MPDTGIFGHDEERAGARVSLLGSDGAHRVWLGPRNGDFGGGIVKVYHASAENGAAPESLRGVARGRLFAVDGPEGPTAILEILGRNPNWTEHPDVRLTIDGLRIHRRMPGRDFVAELGIDENGGFLRLTGRSGIADEPRTVRIDTDGIRASVKDYLNEFVVDHPEDPESEIHYSVVEAPEVGVFARGTARLQRGEARAPLPGHFAHVASAERLTVHLTPRSQKSKGVAATNVSTNEIVIRELGRGRGTYDVDWLVHGVRRGREDYRVVRPRDQGLAPRACAKPRPAPANQSARDT